MERALLGALLSDGTAMCQIAHMVSPESFYRPTHRALYSALSDMFERGYPIDLVTVADKLRANNKLDEVGGVPYLSEIAAECPTSANIEHYALVIEKAYYHRSIQRIIAEANENISSIDNDAEDVMTTILDKSARLRAKHGVRKSMSSREAVKKTADLISHIKSRKYTGGITTGIERLDRVIVEFEPGELIVIAARPSIGKTALSQAISDHNSIRGVPGMFFSLEMPIDQIVSRSISRQSGVPLHILKSRYEMSDQYKLKSSLAQDKMSQWPLIYDDNRYSNAREISNAIRANMFRTKIKYVVIDQLSRIVPDVVNEKEYRAHLNNVISGLKHTATSLGITIFLLHQINRDVKDSKDRRPRIDDLKDTGKLEEDADGVILIHRPEYYNDPKTKNLNISGETYPVSGHAEIIVAKRRQGATGSVAVGYIGNLTKFYNLDAPDLKQQDVLQPQEPEGLSEIIMDGELPF